MTLEEFEDYVQNTIEHWYSTPFGGKDMPLTCWAAQLMGNAEADEDEL